jgi:PAS domain S-box-containing protein
MNDQAKTNAELIKETSTLKQKIRKLEQSESERKRASDALRESEEYFKAIIQNSSDIILVVDKLGTITYASPSIERFLGYEPDEVIGKRILDLIVPEDKPRAIADFGRALLTKEIPIPNVFRIRHKDGTERVLEGIGNNLLDNPIVAGFVMNVRDITERKKAENALRESEKRYHELNDFLPISTFEVDAAGNIISYNRTALETFRYNEEDFKAGMNVLQFFAPEEWQRVEENMRKIIQGTSTPGQEFIFLRKDGSKFTGLIYAALNIQQNKTVGIRGVIIDITERKQAEVALRESESLSKSLIDYMHDAVLILNWDGSILFANLAAAKIIEYERPEAFVGHNMIEYLHPDSFQKAAEDIEAVKAGKMGFPSEYQLFSVTGRRIWVESIGGNIIFRNASANLVCIRDITERKQAEEELLRTLESLRKAVGATIQVMVSAVEARDPYTAGHQLRTADLARTIATDMGLTQDTIDAIRMAGSIHDIGKLYVPSEILTKPSKLTDIELSLIKEHSRRGYEMLKDVESPWPLADIIYQHHERMDGSGYPRNLKGDDILMEARILAISDVVESMGSHRPYRPSLGIEAAIEEIEKNRGKLYDTGAVDACLRVFREKGYQLLQ